MDNLHDQLRDAAGDVPLDLTSLADHARRQGTRQRRVRRALIGVGTAAAVTVLGAGTWWVVAPGQAPRSEQVANDPSVSLTPDAPTPTVPVSPPSSSVGVDQGSDEGGDGGADPADMDQVPITARSAAGLLHQLVTTNGAAQVAPDSIRGQLDESTGNVYAQMQATGATGGSRVQVDVQHLSMMPEVGRTCAEVTQADTCAATPLADGDVLRRYTTQDKAGSTEYVAEYLSETQDLRVLVLSAASDGTSGAVGPEALATMAQDRQWGLYVTRATAALGQALSSYRTLG